MEWISVQDGVPKNEDYVIVSFGDEVQYLPCWCHKGVWYKYNTPYNVTSLVTHWMQLPNSPLNKI